MRSRRVFAALSIVLIVVLTIATAVSINRLLVSSVRYFGEANDAVDLGGDLGQLTAADWNLVRAPGADTVAAARSAGSSAQVALDRVRRGPFDRTDTARLSTAVQRFINDSAAERDAFAVGQTTRAEALASANDAEYAALVGPVQALVGELRARAKHTASRVDIDVIGLTMLAVIAIGVMVGWMGHRRRSFQQLAVKTGERARFEAIVGHGNDVVVLTDANWRVTYVSPSVRGVLGYERTAPDGELLGRTVAPDSVPDLLVMADAARADGIGGPIDVRLRHADGTWRTMEMTVRDMRDNPDVGGFVWSSRDVTERRRLEAELERAAFQDSLTHLANRALFLDRLNQSAARVRRHGGSTTVLLADLDGFKEVNDSFGHEVGDEVLMEIAARFFGCVREGDTVARLGGDEFTILLEDADEDSVLDICERIVDAARRPIDVCGAELRLGVSVGIASSNGDVSAPDLLRNADTAMYAAKDAGRGRGMWFEPAMQIRVREHVQVASEFDTALEQGQFEVHYQPLISLVTGAVEGAEALVRWRHPERGLLAPAIFIPVAEQTGQIVPLGRWVLAEACTQAAAWKAEAPDVFQRMTVNVSGCQLADPGFVNDVRTVLADTGLDPTSLVLEIAESVLLHDVERSSARLRELKELGVKLAVDDFGTGYSSLAQLRRFPVDVLKIDRTFVAAIDHAADGEALVRAIVDLGATLRLTTVAEGIEEPGQAEALVSMGCGAGQGYLYSHAVSAAEFSDMLGSDDPFSYAAVAPAIAGIR